MTIWWRGTKRKREEEGEITVEEAVVFEAAPAEQRVEGVQRLLSLDRLGERAINVGGALRRKLDGAGRLQKVLVPVGGMEAKVRQ